jgi:hypothetical protein
MKKIVGATALGITLLMMLTLSIDLARREVKAPLYVVGFILVTSPILWELTRALIYYFRPVKRSVHGLGGVGVVVIIVSLLGGGPLGIFISVCTMLYFLADTIVAIFYLLGFTKRDTLIPER